MGASWMCSSLPTKKKSGADLFFFFSFSAGTDMNHTSSSCKFSKNIHQGKRASLRLRLSHQQAPEIAFVCWPWGTSLQEFWSLFLLLTKQFSGTDNWYAAATARLHMGWSKKISKASFEGRENTSCKIGSTRVNKTSQQLHCSSGYSQRTSQTSTFASAMSSPGNQSLRAAELGPAFVIFCLSLSPSQPSLLTWQPKSPKHKWSCPNSVIWATRLGPTAPFLLPAPQAPRPPKPLSPPVKILHLLEPTQPLQPQLVKSKKKICLSFFQHTFHCRHFF